MNENLAKVGVNKSLLKEFNVNGTRTVYMNNGEEFQIQLFNPYQHKIAVDIFIENESIGNLLILDPGERFWLERFMDKHSKFKFKTYTVEGDAETRAAISHNGEIKIVFKRFARKSETCISKWVNPTFDYNDSCVLNCDASIDTVISKCCDTAENSHVLRCKSISAPVGTSNTSLGLYNALLGSSVGSVTASVTTNSTNDIKVEVNSAKSLVDAEYTKSVDTIETGRIDEGSYSSQNFTLVDGETKEILKTEYIKILPQSQKPYTTNDLQKIYCVECGHKLNQKYKFCPYCGTKIE